MPPQLADALPATRPVRYAHSVDDMLAGAVDRQPWKGADSLSGSHFERVTIDRKPFVVKYLCVDDDWIMRATGDLHCRQLTLLTSGVLDLLPAVIDHTIVACAPYISPRRHRGAALIMHDVSSGLVPPGSDDISIPLHHQFLEHMALLHAAYLGFANDGSLFPLMHHYVMLTPTMSALEAVAATTDPIPPAVGRGWRLMEQQHPRQARILLDLARDPSPLVAALQVGPSTLVHGDWKLGNLGSVGAVTILLDWDRCGEGPPLIDLAWYLAVNCDRIPETKEEAIAFYRRSLEDSGVDTSPWWDAQLAAALAGAFLQLGWSKNEDAAEFAWWSDRLDEALRLL
jgi:hypothetical protein